MWLYRIFWTQLAVFLLLFSSILLGYIPRMFFLPVIGLFFVLGVALTILTWKAKVKKLYFYLVGFSSIGFFAFVMLHNFFYALGIHFGLFALEVLHAVFFIIAAVVCPLAFIIGVVGVIYRLFK